ncbi:MAG: gluconokinase [Anaerolineae bacterium]|nr:gluconokinase [Anaerolineae bacterium]
MTPPRVIILMGVSGAGKTTIGRRLAAALGWDFLDGDDYHPPANVAKMGRGEPLTDADRIPWLDRLHDLIARRLAADEPAVLAASALKETYRQRLLAANPGATIVYLRGDYDLIQRRLKHRTGHYMPSALLHSQFAALEPPANALTVDVAQPPAAIIRHIRTALGV